MNVQRVKRSKEITEKRAYTKAGIRIMDEPNIKAHGKVHEYAVPRKE